MSDEVKRYRLHVLDVLGIMAGVQERLRVEAKERGDDVMGAIHAHSAMVLREAQNAFRSLERV